MSYPKTLSAAHERLLNTIITELSKDARILGIGAGGSFASDNMDRYSDLDLVIATDPSDFEEVMHARLKMINSISGCLVSFTGEHVGEPRLIIALFLPELLHVDFKFVTINDAANRVDNTKVLWERQNCLSKVYAASDYQYPQPDINWIENRFWVWVHYAVGKIARGEYFEAIEFLSFLRTTVLSPLALQQNGLVPSGVRNLETRLPSFADKLKTTLAGHDKASLVNALNNVISIYLELRSNEEVSVNADAQEYCLKYLNTELAIK